MSNVPSSIRILYNTESNNKNCSQCCGNCKEEPAIAFESKAIEGSFQEETSGLTGNDGSILQPEEQVLPTLSRDGKRRWINPMLAPGSTWHYRRWVAYGLIAFFVTLPHFRFHGKPYVLIDIASREFTFLGHTFYPTDTALLACIMLGSFFAIMLVTSLAGRIWCGWGCPQTVYTEFLFRPIDRLFSGTIGRGGKGRHPMTAAAQFGRFFVYLVCCMFLAHTFLSYFVGTDRLARWIVTPPSEHPVAFLIMAGSTAALMFHFLYFREQLCLIACPYGRFQSVMLDRKSLIVAYDARRGEPRKKGKREPLSLDRLTSVSVGDCIDCGRCTAVCPTGIDIRNGLQLECIHCAQCIDACEDVMKKTGQPIGLIRYTSQDGLEGKPNQLLRPRTVIYTTALGLLTCLFIFILSYKFAFDARIFRLPGAPFSLVADQQVQNNFKLRLTNRSQNVQQYKLDLDEPLMTAKWSDGSESMTLQPGESRLLLIAILFPPQKTMGAGSTTSTLKVTDSSGSERKIPIYVHGPR